MIPGYMHAKELLDGSHVNEVNDPSQGHYGTFKCQGVVGCGGHVVNVYSHYCTALVILLDEHTAVNADPSKPCFTHLIVETCIPATSGLF